MALAKEIPQEMIDTTDKPYHIHILEMKTSDRCEEVYRRIKVDGWPIERTCIFFDVSSVWYRNQMMRYSRRWDREIAEQQKIQKANDGFEKRFMSLLQIEDDEDVEAFYDALFDSDISKKAISNEDDEWIDCSPITDQDILSLRDAMIAARKVIDDRHKRFEEKRAQEAKE